MTPRCLCSVTAMPVQWDCGYGCSDTATAVQCYRGRAAVNLPFVVKSETQQLVELKVAFEILRFGYTVVISHV